MPTLNVHKLETMWLVDSPGDRRLVFAAFLRASSLQRFIWWMVGDKTIFKTLRAIKKGRLPIPLSKDERMKVMCRYMIRQRSLD